MKTLATLVLATLFPILGHAQWFEPEIDFDSLTTECPRWSDSREDCPYLLEFHGYDIYLSKDMVDSRAETWDFDGLFSCHIISPPEELRDCAFYNEDADRALSKRLLEFLSAFEAVFVPESPNFNQRNSGNMIELVPLLRDLDTVPNASRSDPDSLGFFLGSKPEPVPGFAIICEDGHCKICRDGECNDGSSLRPERDVHYPDCEEDHAACYHYDQFAFGFYLADTYDENLYQITHEFGHMWHDLFVPRGLHNRCIMSNYDAAMEADRFRDYSVGTARQHFASSLDLVEELGDTPAERGTEEWLDYWNELGGGGASYAATNNREYFAELTAIWFGNQWDQRGYPGDAQELWEHDQPSYEMIRQAYSESLLPDFPTNCR